MKHYLERSMSFAEYMALIESVVIEGKTTGPTQLGALADFTRLNLQRMKRLSKTVEINNGSKIALKENTRPIYWLVITEAWCGDAAQNIPVIEKIAAENDNIETRYILRDENPELMDQFLTNGGKAIPKLIVLNSDHKVVAHWGPRPAGAIKLIVDYKAEHGVVDEPAKAALQMWYLHDKGLSTQRELLDIMKNVESKK